MVGVLDLANSLVKYGQQSLESKSVVQPVINTLLQSFISQDVNKAKSIVSIAALAPGLLSLFQKGGLKEILPTPKSKFDYLKLGWKFKGSTARIAATYLTKKYADASFLDLAKRMLPLPSLQIMQNAAPWEIGTQALQGLFSNEAIMNLLQSFGIKKENIINFIGSKIDKIIQQNPNSPYAKLLKLLFKNVWLQYKLQQQWWYKAYKFIDKITKSIGSITAATIGILSSMSKKVLEYAKEAYQEITSTFLTDPSMLKKLFLGVLTGLGPAIVLLQPVVERLLKPVLNKMKEILFKVGEKVSKGIKVALFGGLDLAKFLGKIAYSKILGPLLRKIPGFATLEKGISKLTSRDFWIKIFNQIPGLKGLAELLEETKKERSVLLSVEDLAKTFGEFKDTFTKLLSSNKEKLEETKVELAEKTYQVKKSVDNLKETLTTAVKTLEKEKEKEKSLQPAPQTNVNLEKPSEQVVSNVVKQPTKQEELVKPVEKTKKEKSLTPQIKTSENIVSKTIKQTSEKIANLLPKPTTYKPAFAYAYATFGKTNVEKSKSYSEVKSATTNNVFTKLTSVIKQTSEKILDKLTSKRKQENRLENFLQQQQKEKSFLLIKKIYEKVSNIAKLEKQQVKNSKSVFKTIKSLFSKAWSFVKFLGGFLFNLLTKFLTSPVGFLKDILFVALPWAAKQVWKYAGPILGKVFKWTSESFTSVGSLMSKTKILASKSFALVENLISKVSKIGVDVFIPIIGKLRNLAKSTVKQLSSLKESSLKSIEKLPGTLKEKVTETTHILSKFFTTLTDKLKTTFSRVAKSISNISKFASGLKDKIVHSFTNIVKSVTNSVSSLFKKEKNLVSSKVSKTSENIKRATNIHHHISRVAHTTVEKASEKSTSFFGRLFSKAKNVATSTLGSIKNVVSKVKDTVVEKTFGLASNALKLIQKYKTKIVQAVADLKKIPWIKSLLSKVGRVLPYIPGLGLVYDLFNIIYIASKYGGTAGLIETLSIVASHIAPSILANIARFIPVIGPLIAPLIKKLGTAIAVGSGIATANALSKATGVEYGSFQGDMLQNITAKAQSLLNNTKNVTSTENQINQESSQLKASLTESITSNSVNQSLQNTTQVVNEKSKEATSVNATNTSHVYYIKFNWQNYLNHHTNINQIQH